MADMAAVIVAGGMGIAGTAVGAGLTYWLGALNRRHQEEREDATRWYEARLKAYAEFAQAAFDADFVLKGGSVEDSSRITARFGNALGTMLLLSSLQVQSAGSKVLHLYMSRDQANFTRAVAEFTTTARKDLGHPEPPS
jgi:hypothetical protein